MLYGMDLLYLFSNLPVCVVVLFMGYIGSKPIEDFLFNASHAFVYIQQAFAVFIYMYSNKIFYKEVLILFKLRTRISRSSTSAGTRNTGTQKRSSTIKERSTLSTIKEERESSSKIKSSNSTHKK